MIKIIKKPVEPIDANAYIVLDTETKKCVIIDFGADFSHLMDLCKDLNAEVCGALLTRAFRPRNERLSRERLRR